jgi:hypothetical protein
LSSIFETLRSAIEQWSPGASQPESTSRAFFLAVRYARIERSREVVKLLRGYWKDLKVIERELEQVESPRRSM